jgi:16S rRNA processing protein RimM
MLAHLVRPQGRHGEILAEILTDFPERFSERKRLFLVLPENAPSHAAKNQLPREVTLEHHWLHKGRVVFKFAGVDSIEAAENLRGLDVAIPAEERAPLADGSVYISDLIGCEVVDVDSAEPKLIGTIDDVDRNASLLVVNGSSGTELLIPFVQAYLVEVNLEAKRIEMRLPPGLLDINTPLTEEERAEQKAQSLDSSGSGE